MARNKTVRYLCAQPATNYYIWQVETMINNFMEMGVNPNHMDIVCWKQNGEIPAEWIKMAETYPARFFFYDDTRETKHYISSIRPNILKQHFTERPEVMQDVIFYHDSDIVFTQPPSEWITDDMVNDAYWYGSDTRWYIAHGYIKGKGQDVLDLMCEIMGMDEAFLESQELNAIGAQYLMKGIDASYWERVESDCEILFKTVTDFNNKKKAENPEYPDLQIWCSDMWSVLWGAWRLGHQTRCHTNFEFSWGTSTADDYRKFNIMHNAGVINDKGGLFYKPNYINKLPYGDDIKITEDTASWKYWEWIQKAGKKSCLI
jgi:hypothetical protein